MAASASRIMISTCALSLMSVKSARYQSDKSILVHAVCLIPLPSLPNFHFLNLLSLVRRAVQVSHVTIALMEPQTQVTTTEMNEKLVLNEEMLPGGMQNSRCKCVGAVDDSVKSDSLSIRIVKAAIH